MKTEAETYAQIDEAVAYIRKTVAFVPKTLIVCGSGLGGLGRLVQNQTVVAYKEIPHWVESTVEGHQGNLVFGQLNGVDVVAMVGRLHFYEGYSFDETTLPIRICYELGARSMVVTNAAGGINQTYKVGDLMVIKDHINFPGLCGFNPLRGPNLARYGPRFPPVNNAYDAGLRRAVLDWEPESGARTVHEGVYAFVSGPSYESNAEVSLISRLGADCVGMSTVPEVIVARHCGMKVLGLSLITNSCNPQDVTTHTEVLMHASLAAEDVEKLLTTIITLM